MLKRSLAIILISALIHAPDAWSAEKRKPRTSLEKITTSEEIPPAQETEVEDLTSGEGRAQPSSGSAHFTLTGWRNRQSFGLWWNRFELNRNGAEIEQAGRPSITFNTAREYNFDPIFVGLGVDFHAPQILFKAVGLSFFYFFCFFLTAGDCNASPSFGTGERDAGFLGFGPYVGYHFSPIPVRIHAGMDLGLFAAGVTSHPFSTAFSKFGIGYEFNENYGLETTIRRSVSMADWDFGNDEIGRAAVWLISFDFVRHF